MSKKSVLFGAALTLGICSFAYLIGFVTTGKLAPEWSEGAQGLFVFSCFCALVLGVAFTTITNEDEN
jgi:hypothetical protein